MRLKISPSAGLNGTITVPGDKSISHRTLILASLAQGESRISNWLPSGDCMATLDAMRALGVEIDVLRQSETSADLLVHGVGLHGLKAPAGPINCQGSGTTMRLLAGILAGQPMEVVLDGHEGLRRRPMERVARPLRRMGADIETTDGRPPLRIKGGRLTGIDFDMPIASGQVKAGVLFAGLYAEGKTIVRQPGPARDHTERLLRSLSVQAISHGNTIELDPKVEKLHPINLSVPGDFSSAAFPILAALLLPGSNLTIQKVNVNETRTGLLDVLHEMGAEITLSNQIEAGGEPLADLNIKTSQLRGAHVRGDTVVRMIDEFPVLAVAATQAKGLSHVHDATELKVKETDRIKCTVDELRKMGAHLIPHPDGFEVYGPTRLKGATVDSEGDHRLAMALAIAGLIAEGETIVKNADVIADSYPGFVRMLQSLGVEVALV